MDEKDKRSIKGLVKKKIYVSAKLYYTLLMAIPLMGILVKNIILQAYINGENLYSPDFGEAIAVTFRYWILYIASAMLLLSVGMFFKSEKIRTIYVNICNFFFTVLICCDIIYARSFFTLPSAADALILKNFSGFESGEVTSLVCKWDILIFADIIILALFTIFVRRKKDESKDSVRHIRKGAVITALVSVGVLTVVPFSASAFERDDTKYNESPEKTSARYSSLGFHVIDIWELIGESFHNEMTEEENKLVDTYFSWKNENLPDNEYAGMFEGKNILFLQIESLESFVIGREINGQEITPNINKLVQNSFYFENIYEQVQGGNSSDADLMFATSRLPVMKGSTFFRYEDVELTSLPRYLVSNGYDSLYTQAVAGSFWNYKKCWSNMIGVDNFVGAEDINMDYEKIGFTINDEDFINEAYPYIKKLEENYYAHIVLNSSHMPFEADEKYSKLNLPEEFDDTYMGGYLQLVNFTDMQIGRLLEMMESDGMLQNTVIVVVGDHTGIHKYYEYSLEGFYSEYPWMNANEKYVVPLIINNSEIEESKRFDVIAGQIDVMPTLAYLMGMPEEEYINEAMGRNLLKTNRSYAIFRDGTVYGDLTKKEEEIVKSSYEVSEILFETEQ